MRQSHSIAAVLLSAVTLVGHALGQSADPWPLPSNGAPPHLRPVATLSGAGAGGKDAAAMTLGFSPDGKRFAIGQWNGCIRLYDAASMTLTREMTRTGKPITCLSFAPSGADFVAAGMTDSLLWWRDATSGDPVRVGEGLGWVHQVAFSCEEPHLVAALEDGRVLLFDIAKRELAVSVGSVEHGAYCIAISPDGRVIAAGGAKGPISLWATKPASPMRKLGVDLDTVTSLAFSGNGRLLVSAGSTLDLWNVSTGERITRLSGFGAFDGACFSPDGCYLVWLTTGGDLCLVETATGHVAVTFDTTHNQLTSLAFSPDGRRLSAGFWGGSVDIWDLECPVQDNASRSLQDLWRELRVGTASSAWEAMVLLSRRADQAVQFIADRIRPVDGTTERVEALLTSLNDNIVETRESATDEIERLGASRVDTWKARMASESSPEVRARLQELIRRLSCSPLVPEGERLRGLRTVSVLERTGGKAARKVLESVAAGFEHADETEAARLAIRRLDRREGERR